VQTVALPTWLQPFNSLQRESFIAPAPDGGLIVAFRWSSILVRVGPEGQVDSLSAGIERTMFPAFKPFPAGRSGRMILRIDPQAPEAAQDLFVVGDPINVLYAGRPPEKGRILDQYLITGRYLGSIRLPVVPLAVASSDGNLFAVVVEPEPAVVKFRKP
jgi:hypothetical protein